MTLALVVLIVFLVVWFFDSAKKKEDKRTYREKTITNVKRQDELWCNNFSKVMSDLEEISQSMAVDGNSIMETIESLFVKYDIPDTRSESEKISALQKHSRLYKEACKSIAENYEDDCAFAKILGNQQPAQQQFGLHDLIWYYPWQPPHIDRPELFFGEPNASITIDDIVYKYDNYGRASNLFATEPARLILRICNLLTIRALDEEKVNYSWNRQESSWQQSDMRIKQYEENKKRYPWLYK